VTNPPPPPPSGISSQFIIGPVTDSSNGQVLAGATVNLTYVYFYLNGVPQYLPNLSGVTGSDGMAYIPVSGISSNAQSVGCAIAATKVSGSTTWQSASYSYNNLNTGQAITGPYHVGTIPCTSSTNNIVLISLTYKANENFSFVTPLPPPDQQNYPIPGATMNVNYTCGGVVNYTQQGFSDTNGNYVVSFDDPCTTDTQRTLTVTDCYSGTTNVLVPCSG